ncbi:MAG: VOC family protein [Gammaproteobacteria bacterium]|nr:VOC family protein [Gammaproteobacteria bacterium]
MNVKSLHQVSLIAHDLDTSIAFYRDTLGLPLIARFDQGPKLAFIDIDGTRLMLEEGEGTVSGSVIYLYVDDIDAAVVEAKGKGVEVVGEPHAIHHDADGTFGAAGESEFMAFLTDPSGNLIALAQRKVPTT